MITYVSLLKNFLFYEFLMMQVIFQGHERASSYSDVKFVHSFLAALQENKQVGFVEEGKWCTEEEVN